MQRQPLHSQQGSVLLLSLVLLTVITLTSVIGMQRSTTQIRMLNNMQHQQEVFNATNMHVELGISYLQGNISTARGLLGPLIVSSGTPPKLNNLATSSDWVAPVPKKTQLSVTDGLQLSEMSQQLIRSKHFLKGNNGASQGGQNKYVFSYRAEGTDRSGRISSIQEIVFNLKGPST